MPSDRILVLQPPSPAYMNVMRDYAGGYGVALKSLRTDYGHEGGCVPFIPALYAGALLKESGLNVLIIDAQAEGFSSTDCLYHIEQFNPQIVISSVNLPSLKGDLAFLKMMKKLLPETMIAAVGTTGKLLYDEVLADDCVTAVVRGDAESVVPMLVDALLNGEDLVEVHGIAYRKGSETIVTEDALPFTDLNRLPMLPYDQLPVHRYREHSWGQDISYMPILDGRGCPFPCRTFCPYPFGFGRKPLYRNPELVVDEVEYLHTHYDTEAFVFRNQNFTLNRGHAEGICNEILGRGLKVRWLCETRLDAVDPEILRLMKSAGCELVHYGLESGDPDLFSAVGKPGSDLDRHGRMVEETRKAGMMPKLNVTIGLPGESWKTIRQTIRTVKRLRPDVVMATIITPYPGTRVFEDAKQQGILLTEDWSEFTGFNPVMKTGYLTPKDLLAAQKMVDRCRPKPALPARALRKVFRLTRRIIGRHSKSA